MLLVYQFRLDSISLRRFQIMVLLALGLAHGYCVMKWVKLLKYLRSLSLLGSYLIVQTLVNSFGWKLSKVILLIYTNFDINSEFIKD